MAQPDETLRLGEELSSLKEQLARQAEEIKQLKLQQIGAASAGHGGFHSRNNSDATNGTEDLFGNPGRSASPSRARRASGSTGGPPPLNKQISLASSGASGGGSVSSPDGKEGEQKRESHYFMLSRSRPRGDHKRHTSEFDVSRLAGHQRGISYASTEYSSVDLFGNFVHRLADEVSAGSDSFRMSIVKRSGSKRDNSCYDMRPQQPVIEEDPAEMIQPSPQRSERSVSMRRERVAKISAADPTTPSSEPTVVSLQSPSPRRSALRSSLSVPWKSLREEDNKVVRIDAVKCSSPSSDEEVTTGGKSTGSDSSGTYDTSRVRVAHTETSNVGTHLSSATASTGVNGGTTEPQMTWNTPSSVSRLRSGLDTRDFFGNPGFIDSPTLIEKVEFQGVSTENIATTTSTNTPTVEKNNENLSSPIPRKSEDSWATKINIDLPSMKNPQSGGGGQNNDSLMRTPRLTIGGVDIDVISTHSPLELSPRLESLSARDRWTSGGSRHHENTASASLRTLDWAPLLSSNVQQASFMLYGSPVCEMTRLLVWFCRVCNVPYNLTLLDPFDIGPEENSFTQRFPNHHLPVLSDDSGLVISEGHAILKYLCRKHKLQSPLLPEMDPALAQVDSWLEWCASSFRRGASDFPLWESLLPHFDGTVQGSSSAQRKAKEAQRLLRRGLRTLETALSTAVFLADTNEPTIADMSVACHLAQTTHLTNVSLDKYPHVQRWYQKMQAYPHFAESHRVIAQIGVSI